MGLGERDVVGAVVAVAARALGVDAANVLRLHAERLREVAAQGEHALAVRPDGLFRIAVQALDLEPVRVRVLDVLGGELDGREPSQNSTCP